MKSLIGYIILAGLGVVGTPAYARIYLQADPVTGVITYSNFGLPAYRAENPSTPTSMPVPVVAPPPAPQANNCMPPTPPAISEPSEPATGNFPRVSTMSQKERDSERRRILNAELSWEQSELDRAFAGKAAGDVIKRHQANIEALQREIGNTK